MRVAIQTLGTRGDVQPYLALARALIDRGHAVQLCAPSQFETFAAAHGVPFASLPGEFLALLDTPEGKAAIAGGKGFGAGFRLLKHVRPLMRRVLDAEWEAIRAFAPDAIIYHPKSLASASAAEKLGRPCILASPLPVFTPTSSFPSPLFPVRSLGRLNRASHLLTRYGPRLLFGRVLRDWREASLGLRGSKGMQPIATIYAYSPSVLPVPRDWPSDVLVSGYWFLDHPDWQPPQALSAFLAAGQPPVYIGFGSMPGIDPERMANLAIDALRHSGNRGILAVGGGAMAPGDVAASVHVLDAAPHDWLMPRMHAAIHHGGAGTTAAVLRAGIPMTICPFFGDQPFWARLMHDLGVAPPALDRKTMSAETMAIAIRAMSEPAMRARAHILGERVRGEDGVGAAMRFIEKRCAPLCGARGRVGRDRVSPSERAGSRSRK